MGIGVRVELLKDNLRRISRDIEITEERSTIFTDNKLKKESLPVRKAIALSMLLNEAPIHIYSDELIVGIPFMEQPSPNTDKEPPLRILPPEDVSGEGYIVRAQKKIESGFSEETYDPVILTLHQYGMSSKYGLFPHYAKIDEIKKANKLGLDENSNPGHLQAGHARVITYGWGGLKKMAEGKHAELDLTKNGNKKKAFLQSVMISLDSARDFALRYASLASKMAGMEDDPNRQKELIRISEICTKISEKPPETFWEALQLHWFTNLICHSQGARQLGRFDQYMYPLLDKDLREGRITKEGALELLGSLWIKYNMLTDFTMDNLQNMILGGQTPDGKDATNLLSYMCLDITDKLDLIDPKVSVRIHKGTPDDFLKRTCEIVKAGKYQPGVYNDEAIIPTLLNIGIPLRDARDYTNDGCSEILVQGKSVPWAFEAKIKLLKCLERVMENLEKYNAFKDLMEAVKEEIATAVEMAVSSCNVLQSAVPRISPNPFVSATVEGCIEKMKDLTEGGAFYNYAAVCASGLADTVDSLAAVKKLVFEEGIVNKKELLNALQNNFEGQERLRQLLLNRAPKFGNDDDYVDKLAVELVDYTAEKVRKHKNPRGGEYILGLFSYGEYIGHGIVTGATPDGRKAGEWISPNFSPCPGRDMKGPYAVLKSTSKVNHLNIANGAAVDITLHPSVFSGPDGIQKLMSLLNAFRELKGIQVQFNVVDEKILKTAQKEPEKYKNLTVRLWGFPAYFVRLPKEFQDHIISRTKHSL